jgi:hypothetical protein
VKDAAMPLEIQLKFCNSLYPSPPMLAAVCAPVVARNGF